MEEESSMILRNSVHSSIRSGRVWRFDFWPPIFLWWFFTKVSLSIHIDEEDVLEWCIISSNRTHIRAIGACYIHFLIEFLVSLSGRTFSFGQGSNT